MKLKHLLKKSFLNENSINNISDISDEKIVGQNGLNYLRSVIEKLNKKSLKWKLPPLKLVILSEKNVPPKSGLYGPEKVSPILVKEYSIKIEGDSPKVEGYEFIAKIEHTPEGNIINVAPGASVKNLPESFRNVNAICDVCKQNRERFNTFVLKMEKDDKQRFPDKKRGDLIMAGSACLKRFLPGISVQSLISYAEIIDDIRNIKEDGDDENNSYDNFERGHPDRTKYHYDVSILMDYICRAYLVEGKYISKSKAFDNQTPTVEAALSSLFDKKEEYFVNVEINKNPNLKEKAKKLSEDVLNWAKTADFDAMAQNSPDFREYYLNLKVVSRSSAISYKNTGYLGGALAAYLRAQGQLEKKKVLSSKNI